MKNLKGDIFWVLFIGLWVIMLGVPHSREAFISVTHAHPYFGGFIKFAILASMGDLLGKRIMKNIWEIPKDILYKAVVWGVLGMAITLIFTIFVGGVKLAQQTGLLAFEGNKYITAFFVSSTMNLTFGPMLYIYHRFGDLYVEQCLENKSFKVDVDKMIKSIDWNRMVRFSWIITCLGVWIPLHTIVFLLPAQYRVLASAFLSILLGILIALSSKSNPKLVNCPN